MPEPPLISVLLPVYNCEKYIGASVESVLQQTESDFELIIIDDGSTDQTNSIVRKYTDPRIRILRQANQGLAASLNVGLAQARGKYVARQDADDISAPERFALQIAFLESNVECALIGTAARIIEGDKLSKRFHRHPTDCKRLRFELLFNNPFVHSSVMFRRDKILSLGGYSTDRQRQPPEDYELWSRVARQWEVRNLPDILVDYRETPGSISRRPSTEYWRCLERVSAENLAYYSGNAPDSEVVRAMPALAHGSEIDAALRLNVGETYKVLKRAVSKIDPRGEQPSLASLARGRTLSLMAAYLSIRSPWFRKIFRNNKIRLLLRRLRPWIFRAL